MGMRSRTTRSIRRRPMRNWFWISSPTARTRRVPRWSISSGSPTPLVRRVIWRGLPRAHALVEVFQRAELVACLGLRALLVDGRGDVAVVRVGVDVLEPGED